jgi:hypothetical protein
MARWEAALIIAIGLGLGLAIAATALLALALPTRWMLRSRPVEAIGVGES